MRIAVVEADASDRKRIVQMIQAYSSPGPPGAEIKEYESCSQVTDALRRVKFDGVFITVETIEDFEMAWKLRDMDKGCRIVFVSSSDCFAVISHRLAVAHYLLKPVKPDEVCEALRRIAERKTL